MNYKLLIGARKAGVIGLLALLLFGVGAWAQVPTEVDLGKVVMPSALPGASALGKDVLLYSSDGKTVDKNDNTTGTSAGGGTPLEPAVGYAIVTMGAKAAGVSPAPSYDRWDSVLVINVEATVTSLTIKGKLTTTTFAPVIQVKINGPSTAEVTWDGGEIVGADDATARGILEFINLGGTGPIAKLNVYSGSITGSARNLITEVDNTNIIIGGKTSGNANGKSLTLTGKGSGATITGSSVVINTPTNGTYKIVGENAEAINGSGSVQIGIGNRGTSMSTTPLVSSGNGIEISGWASASSAPGTGSAAILSGGDITILNGSSNSITEKVVVKSRGQYVLRYTGSSSLAEINVYNARLEHGVYASSPVVVSNASGKINLQDVKVYGFSGTSAATSTTTLPGMIAQTSGEIEISQGVYAPANLVAVATDAAIKLYGVKLSSKGTPTSHVAVVSGGTGGVILRSSGTKDAEVLFDGGDGKTFRVDGIVANSVVIGEEPSGSPPSIVGTGLAGVKVNNGIGNGIVAKEVRVLGVNSDKLAYITVKDGRAIESYDNNAGASATNLVKLKHVKIERTGTTITGREELVWVVGGNVTFEGVNSVLDASKGTGSIAISVSRQTAYTSGLAGSVVVDGGKITGDKNAIVAAKISVTDGINVAADKTQLVTVISAKTDATLLASGDVTVNNGAAVILLTDGKNGAASAAIKALAGNILILNADSIVATGTGAAGLLAVSNTTSGTDANVDVVGGKIRSAGGTAILADGAVTVDQRRLYDAASATGNLNDNANGNFTSGFYGKSSTNPAAVNRLYVLSSRAVNVESNGAAAYAGIESKLQNVYVGWAKVTAKQTGTPAIRVINGTGDNVVTVNDERANIKSELGDGIKVDNGNVLVTEGSVESGAAASTSAVYAAINAKNGDVRVSQVFTTEYLPSNKKSYLIASGAGSIGIYVTSQNTRSVVVVDKGTYTSTTPIRTGVENGAVIDIKNTGASAGAVQVVGDVQVFFYGDITADQVGQKSYGIRASLGLASDSDPIIIGGYANIKMADGPAVVDTNVNIIITDKAYITGKSGVLVRLAKRDATVKKFSVTVGNPDNNLGEKQSQTGVDPYVYSFKGPVIKSIDSVVVRAGTVKTDQDTAVTAGSDKLGGYVNINGGKVWAGGYNPTGSGTTKPKTYAVVAKHVELLSGEVEANTTALRGEDEERYPNVTAIGIRIPGPATVSGGAHLTIKSGAATAAGEAGAKVTANGASIGIDNLDSLTVFGIYGTAAATKCVEILAGHGGIGIQSVGPVYVSGADPFTTWEDNYSEDDGLKVSVRVKAGNGAGARAINLPVSLGRLTPTLRVDNAYIEAGESGAIAINSGTGVIDSLGHSVVFVRGNATAVKADGGAYVNKSYIEVLSNKGDTTGTAIEGRKIRISGGNSADDLERSEVHSKGVALRDTVTGNKIQITGSVFLSGTLASDVNIGSSVIGDSASVTLGGIGSGTREERFASRELWRLSVASDVTAERENGKRLTIPKGVTVAVTDNRSYLRALSGDTVKIIGKLTTEGAQGGSKFLNNGGKTIVEAGGNIKFSSVDVQSFQNNGGTVVLKSGALLNDTVLVHDTGTNITRLNNTFLKWADTLSGNVEKASRSRGVGKVIVPPLYAALDGDQSKVVDQEIETSKGKWDANSTRTDTVYTAVNVDYPLDKRYANYLETADFPAKGNFKLGADNAITIDEDSTRVFTLAGTFTRTATLTNEAGTGTKTYTHNVLRVPYKKISEWQVDGHTPFFFEGFLTNTDGKRVPDKDTTDVTIRNGDVQVLYTGNTAHKLVDRVFGGALPQDYWSVAAPETPVYYQGLGNATFWYEGADDDTRYQLSSNTPVAVGLYNVFASFAQGDNFEAVPSDPSKVVYIGQVEIIEGTLESVFGFKDSKYDIPIKLEAKKAWTNVKVPLLNLLTHGAKYNEDNLDPSGSGSGAYVANSAKLAAEDTLVFSVNNTSEYNQVLVFTLPVDPSYGGNFNTDQQITVTVKFVTANDMKEDKPEITVNYRDAKLTGFKAGAQYTINGTVHTPVTDTIAIAAEWEGATLKIVKLPDAITAAYGAKASDTAQVPVAARPTTASAAVLAVKGDSSSTSTTPDGILSGTTAAMEYKLASSATWIRASDVATRNLIAGTYNVRDAATDTSFAGPSVTVVIAAKAVSVAESNREIPTANTTTEAAVAPVKVTASVFTAGPSPVSKSKGEISFFSSKTIKSGAVYIFDANGKTVAKAKVKGTGKIGTANVSRLAEGSYVIKGALVGKDGTKEKVSFVFSVVK